MKITNRYSLPAPIVRAVTFGQRTHRPKYISVIEAIKPPQMRALEIKHADELTEDASDRLFALMGSAVHSVLERAMTDNVFQEERLSAEVGGWTVTGMPDLLEYDADADGYLLSDYKLTSVAAFFGGVKAEWEAQINCYAHLFRLHGFEVDAAQIVAMLRDWQLGHSLNSGDYPPIPIIVLPVPLWPAQAQAAYVLKRVQAHKAVAEGAEPPPCTSEERWERATVYAVIKNGNKRAAPGGLHNALDEADAWGRENIGDGKYRVDQRLGTSMRCARYCNVGKETGICPQWTAIKQLMEDTTNDID